MSEPTYRIDLTDDLTATLPFKATVVRLTDDWAMRTFETSISRDEAFERARLYVVALTSPSTPDHSVLLTEDGDILDPHEVQR